MCADCAAALDGLVAQSIPSMIPRKCSDCRANPAARAYAEKAIRAQAAERRRFAYRAFERGTHGRKTIETQLNVADLLDALAGKAR